MSSKFHSSLVLYWASTENAHVKIDLKSLTLSGLGTDRRFVDFLSYFRTLSGKNKFQSRYGFDTYT